MSRYSGLSSTFGFDTKSGLILMVQRRTLVLAIISLFVLNVHSYRGLSTRLVVREGHQTELPCDLRTGLDSDASGLGNETSFAVVHWYHHSERDHFSDHYIPPHEGHQPIYTVDFGPADTVTSANIGGSGQQRGNNLLQVNRSANKAWAGRAYFSIIGHPASLKVNSVRFEDAGTYTCSAIFRDGARRDSTVRLHVVAPPEPPVIRDAYDQTLKGLIGPYNEGAPLALVCVVYGGKPKPTLVWSGVSEDMPYEIRHSSEAQITTATLQIHRLRREDLKRTLTCNASNNISSPASTSVTLDLNLAPVTVKIRRGDTPISASLQAEVVCEVWGSRPPPTVTWWNGLQQLNQTFVYVSPDGNVTTSVVSFKPTAEDHGSMLACRATNPLMDVDNVEEDTWKMDVQYQPKINLQLGSKLNIENIHENQDVYLECQVDAYPQVDDVQWKFNGQDLYASENIFLAKNFLVIQRVQTSHSGFFSCTAENSEGRTEGDQLYLRVQHAPICKEHQTTVYPVSRHQEVQVYCEVLADPTNVTFEWYFNSSVHHREIKTHKAYGTRSVAHYTPHGHSEYGTLLCSAANRIGPMQHPCVFHVVQAGPPSAIENCTIGNQTDGSMHLRCVPGKTNHLQQRFTMVVRNNQNNQIIANTSSEKPDFWVHGLSPGIEYHVVVWASNDQGRGPETTLVPPILPHVGKLTKSGNVVTLTSNTLIITAVVALSVLCLLLPLVIFTAIKVKRKQLFLPAKPNPVKPETKDSTGVQGEMTELDELDGLENGNIPTSATGTVIQLQEASQLHVIYPKDDPHMWLVKQSTGL